MEWLRIDSTFPESPKVAKLARAIGVSRDTATLHILKLLCWTARVRDSGTYEGLENADIAEGAGWFDDPDTFVTAMIDCRWFVQDGNCISLKGWRKRQLLLAHREKMKRLREKKKTDVPSLCRNGADTVYLNRQTDRQTDQPTNKQHSPPPPSGTALSQDEGQKLDSLRARIARAWPKASPDVDLLILDQLRNGCPWPALDRALTSTLNHKPDNPCAYLTTIWKVEVPNAHEAQAVEREKTRIGNMPTLQELAAMAKRTTP